jgi:hypothetical protein
MRYNSRLATFEQRWRPRQTRQGIIYLVVKKKVFDGFEDDVKKPHSDDDNDGDDEADQSDEVSDDDADNDIQYFP